MIANFLKYNKIKRPICYVLKSFNDFLDVNKQNTGTGDIKSTFGKNIALQVVICEW